MPAHQTQHIIDTLETRLASSSQDVDAMRRLAAEYGYEGNREKAIYWGRQSLRLAPHDALVIHQLVVQHGDSEILSAEDIRSRLEYTGLNDQDRATLLHTLAHLERKAGNYDASAKALHHANRIFHSLHRPNIDAFTKAMAHIPHYATREWIHTHQLSVREGDFTPIFILGMPRSGTSLLHNMLAAHTETEGAGECNYITEALKHQAVQMQQDYPAILQHLSTKQLETIRDYYVTSMREQHGNARYVIDKMPANISYAAIIHTIFPQARIIFAERDAMDCCFSIYWHPFQSGAQPHAYNQRDVALWYMAVNQLHRYWQNILPHNRYCSVSYETLVGETELTLRKLLDFCGLEWQPQCLSFHEQKTTVKTASVMQVREPIHNKGLKQWQAYAPYLEEMLFWLAKTEENNKNWPEASAYYETLMQHGQCNAKLLCDAATTYCKWGQEHKAYAALRQAIQQEPDNATAAEFLGTVAMFLGKIDEAIGWHKKAVEIQPERITAWYRLASGLNAYEHVSIPILDELLQNSAEPTYQALLYHAKASLYRHRGEVEQSAAALQKANAIYHRLYGREAEEIRTLSQKTEHSFSAEWIEKHQLRTGNKTIPVFIVGMPRSGTSLMQQMLSAHSHIEGAGECFYVWDVIRQWQHSLHGTYPDIAPQLTKNHLRHLRHYYFIHMHQRFGNVPVVVDKMPNNILNIAVIRAAFPEAKIIFMNREPMDCCFSIYWQLFNAPQPYAYDQHAIATWYKATDTLARYWQHILPQHCYAAIHYETLVASPEETMRQLLTMLELSWEEACLQPDKKAGAMHTSSAVQVRQPIHTKANKQWEPYAPYLQIMQHELKDM